ncbi:hypothetical protein [Roseivirga pacifica]|uniref:hypothetical protein n=1 Tax=Roseivirga pacifica TaxID=1267423 RepID=UPI00227ACD5F|nr:hypothetical protein [Roseivirga pacifica]
MPHKPKASLAKRILTYIKVLMVAYMVGMANSIKHECNFMEDTFIKTELVQEQEDDDPFE